MGHDNRPPAIEIHLTLTVEQLAAIFAVIRGEEIDDAKLAALAATLDRSATRLQAAITPNQETP